MWSSHYGFHYVKLSFDYETILYSEAEINHFHIILRLSVT